MNTAFPLRRVDGISLGDLLAGLGPRAATLIGAAAPVPAAPAILGVEFHDALEELPDRPGLLLLVPSGADPAPHGLADLLARAAAHGYAAVALKCRDADEGRLGEIAAAHGVALVRVAPSLSWRLFEASVSRLLGGPGLPDEARLGHAEPLFALANELASAFGGSVAIEDLERRILAYSSLPGQVIDPLRTQGILSRRVPDSPVNDDEYRAVLRSETALKFPRLGDDEPRVACAIRVGTLPLGTVWAIDASGDGPLTDDQDRRIRDAAALAAAHLLDDLRLHRTGEQPRAERLRTLLDGTEVAGVELAELGLSEERGAALLAVAIAPATGPAVLAQLRSVVQRQLALHRAETVSVVRSGRVFALVPVESARPVAELVGPLLPVIDRLVGPGARVALPGVAHRAADVAGLRGLADRLLDVHARSGATERIITIDSLRPLLVLDRVSVAFAEEPELRSPAVDEMAIDEPRLAETLLTWCASLRNVARTARALGVHENTVRHRLARAEGRYGVRTGMPDELLTAWLQLRALHRTAPSAHGSSVNPDS